MNLKMKKSREIFKQAKQLLPGGVNSPVRSFSSVGGEPFFVKKAKGAYLTDEDGNRYIDYIGSWGAQILGHCDSRIVKIISQTIREGITYGIPCKKEVAIAKKITEIYSSISKVRMVNSGTEATMSAIRLARGYTGRTKILKFNGCYHGHADSFLIKAGSGASTLGSPDSKGVPKSFASETISVPYNDIQAVKAAIRKNKLACIIIEPIAGNMNFIRSDKFFLKELRDLCSENKILLIFDEVMTGFRVSLAGAQNLYKIKPDITTLGKVLGGGFPVGAFGGKSEIMNCLSPAGNVYQAGTLSGNPVAMAAGIGTLDIISKKTYFRSLSKLSRYFTNSINLISDSHKVNMSADSEGGMFGIYFSKVKPSNYKDLTKKNIIIFKKFFGQMLTRGIYFAPSAFEAGFISSAHKMNDINKTLNIIEDWVKKNKF
tara:strand:+ start:22507 stop:23796 length:1290 start_codon:yes stop_codon:yes gene_type:complete